MLTTRWRRRGLPALDINSVTLSQTTWGEGLKTHYQVPSVSDSSMCSYDLVRLHSFVVKSFKHDSFQREHLRYQLQTTDSRPVLLVSSFLLCASRRIATEKAHAKIIRARSNNINNGNDNPDSQLELSNMVDKNTNYKRNATKIESASTTPLRTLLTKHNRKTEESDNKTSSITETSITTRTKTRTIRAVIHENIRWAYNRTQNNREEFN